MKIKDDNHVDDYLATFKCQKMKRLLPLLLLLFSYNLTHSQKSMKVMTLAITNATSNGVDITDLYVKKKESILFFFTAEKGAAFMSLLDTENCTAFMSVLDTKNNNKLFGRVSTITKPVITEETSSTYKYKSFVFNWSYEGDDGKNHSAFVLHKQVFTPDNTLFDLSISFPNNRTCKYKGYIQGIKNIDL